MSHDDGFRGCDTGPEQEGHGKREEETISWFHCDSSTSALKPRPKPKTKAATAGGCLVPQRHARQQFMSGCAAAACYCTITLRGKPARRWFHQKQRSSIWPRSAWRQGAQTQRRNRDHIPYRHARDAALAEARAFQPPAQ